MWNVLVRLIGGVHDMRWFGVAVLDDGLELYRIDREAGWMFRMLIWSWSPVHRIGG